MVNIIVAFAADERCAQYKAVLEEAGIQVFRKCTSASEVKRAFNQCGDGILISSCRLPDSTVDALAWDMGKQVLILAVGRQDQIELCEHPDLFRMTVPCSKGELLSAVNMLLQLHSMRIPRRTDDDKRLIDAAKAYLMEKRCMTEPEAHRFLQKGAMDSGQKMAAFAARILKTNK